MTKQTRSPARQGASKPRATAGAGRKPARKAATPRRGRRAKHPWNPRLGERICARMAEGDTIQRLCRRHDMPAWATIHRWLASNPDFRQAWRDARAAHAELLIDEALEIARDQTDDTGTWRKTLLGELHWQYGVRYASGRWADKPVADATTTTREEAAERKRRHDAAWTRVAEARTPESAAAAAKTATGDDPTGAAAIVDDADATDRPGEASHGA